MYFVRKARTSFSFSCNVSAVLRGRGFISDPDSDSLSVVCCDGGLVSFLRGRMVYVPVSHMSRDPVLLEADSMR